MIKFSPLTKRRIQNFRSNKRGMISTYIFGIMFIISIFADFIANDKPIFIFFDGKPLVPIIQNIPEIYFGGEFETEADYKDPFVIELIEEKIEEIIESKF